MDEESGTASLEAARAHARSQAGADVVHRATIPSTGAVDLPPGIAPAQVRWDERLAAGSYTSVELRRGSVVRVSDLTGDTCVNVQVFNRHLPSERLNPADTVKVQWQAYLEAGSLLLSDRGRVLMTFVADTGSGHDALCGHRPRRANDEQYGSGRIGGPTPATRDLLALAAARHGLERRDLSGGINLFASVPVGADGSLGLAAPSGRPAHVELRADLDVIVLLAVAPHPLDDRPAYVAGDVRVTAWAADHPDPDPFRATTPERTRAFENTDQLLLGGRS